MNDLVTAVLLLIGASFLLLAGVGIAILTTLSPSWGMMMIPSTFP